MYKIISQVKYLADKGPTVILCVPNQNANNPPTDQEIINFCIEVYSPSLFDRRLLIYEITHVDSCRCPDEKQVYKTTHNHVTLKGRPGSYDEVSRTLADHLASLPIAEVITIEMETRDKEGQENLNRGAREELARRKSPMLGYNKTESES